MPSLKMKIYNEYKYEFNKPKKINKCHQKVLSKKLGFEIGK